MKAVPEVILLRKVERVKAELIEWGIIFGGIASLWPRYILHWPHPFWQYLAYVTLALLIGVFVRRLKRITGAKGQGGGGKLPPL